MNHTQLPGVWWAAQLLPIVGLLLLSTPIALATPSDNSAKESELIDAALTRVTTIDGEGRLFSFSIGAFGSLTGMGLGAWILHDEVSTSNGRPDPVIFGASIALTGAAACQLIHGALRFDERAAAASTAEKLLNNPSTSDSMKRIFLEHRAAESSSTRFWGAVMTTAQGVATTALGGRLWAVGEPKQATVGKITTAFGVLTTAIGTIHFVGKSRSERDLESTVVKTAPVPSLKMTTLIIKTADGSVGPGLVAEGRF